eukprot:g38687.t1
MFHGKKQARNNFLSLFYYYSKQDHPTCVTGNQVTNQYVPLPCRVLYYMILLAAPHTPMCRSLDEPFFLSCSCKYGSFNSADYSPPLLQSYSTQLPWHWLHPAAYSLCSSNYIAHYPIQPMAISNLTN